MPARLQVLLAAICFGTTGPRRRSARAGRRSPSAPRGSCFGGLLLALVARGLRVRMPRVGAPLVGMAAPVAVYQLSFFAAVRLTGVAVAPWSPSAPAPPRPGCSGAWSTASG